MQTLQHRRNNAHARVQVLRFLMQIGFTDGITQISFDIASLSAQRWLDGWFKGTDDITYTFTWKGNQLSYKQAQTQPLRTHSVTLPDPRRLTRRFSSEQKSQHVANVRDRSTFSCGHNRIARNRTCTVSGVGIERELKRLLGLF